MNWALHTFVKLVSANAVSKKNEESELIKGKIVAIVF